MKRILFYISLILGVMPVSCTGDILNEEGKVGATDNTVPEDAYVPGRIIVRFDDEMTALIEADLASGGVDTKSPGLNSLVESLGIKSMTRLFPHAGEYEPRTRAEGLHRWYTVEYDPSVMVTKASESFTSLPGVELVEPAGKAVSTSVGFFNDPQLERQWHYFHHEGLEDFYSEDSGINVVPVWERYTTGSDKVIVAVCDAGVDQNHEDLKDNLIGGINYVNSNLPVQAEGHGTHVAGTIAAVNNNGIGVCGIAGGDASKGTKGVKIWSAHFLGGGSSAAAIKGGADNGAVISQNSWEYPGVKDIYQSDMAAIDYFIKYAGCDNEGNQRPDSPMKGGVVIFSSGNQWADFGNPASYEPVIAVGSIQHYGQRPNYSNYGDWVDICAPGGDGTTSSVLSTLPDNQYGTAYGTSMAAPHVSGVAALLVSYYGGPGFTNKMLEEKLIKGGKVKEFDYPNGVQLDALGSFEFGSAPPEPVTSAEVSVSQNTVSMSFAVTADEDNGKAFAYMILAGKNKESLSVTDYRNLPPYVLSAYSLVQDNMSVGDNISVALKGLEFGTEYHVAVVGYDYSRNYSVISPVYKVVTDSNRPPVISTKHEGTLTVNADRTLTVEYKISDPDGHSFKVSFESGSEAASCMQSLDGKCVVTIVGGNAPAGSYEAGITATDEYGSVSEVTLKYDIKGL